MRMFVIVLLALGAAVLLASQVGAGENSNDLKAKLDKVASGFHGVLGYSLHHRGAQDESISLNGDEAFPTCSTIKTAVMIEALHQVAEGKIAWHDMLEVPADDEDREAGGFAYLFKKGSKLELGQWVHLMITVSDNTATIALREHLGQKNINDWLEAHGFKQTKMLNGSKCDELGLRPLQRKYGLGMTTPNEMLRLLEMIKDSKAGTPAACDRMIRLMNHQYWDDNIASEIPPNVTVGSKSGAMDYSRSDTAIICAPTGDYILTVYTKNIKDQSWRMDNEANATIREISKLVWQHYNPGCKWTQPDGYRKLMPIDSD